jgi:predicted porin
MKKSLIALAALATVATAAQAQSSVTIYGIIDSGVLQVKGANAANQSVTTLTSGALSTSRWGFKGTEDLGGGLKANFTLEGQFEADTGAQTGDLFQRSAFVQLDKDGLGSVTLGRQNSLDYLSVIGADPFGANNFGGAVNVAYLNAGINGGAHRVSNAVTLRSASFSGFSAAVQHSFGEVAGETSGSTRTAYTLEYAQGPVKVNFTTARKNDATGNKSFENRQFVGSYKAPFATLFAGYQEAESAGAAADIESTYVGAIIPVNANVNVLVNYTDVKNLNNVSGRDADAFAIGVTYALSKRTTAYAMHGQSNNDTSASALKVTSLGAGAAGVDQKATTVGIRHTF